jgi:hypothetical protein
MTTGASVGRPWWSTEAVASIRMSAPPCRLQSAGALMNPPPSGGGGVSCWEVFGNVRGNAGPGYRTGLVVGECSCPGCSCPGSWTPPGGVRFADACQPPDTGDANCARSRRNRLAEILIARQRMLPRQVLPSQFYLITRRCAQRKFLLRPDTATNNAFLYCLIAAGLRCQIEVQRALRPSRTSDLCRLRRAEFARPAGPTTRRCRSAPVRRACCRGARWCSISVCTGPVDGRRLALAS